jgi:CheY-like chemotaxis protein
METRPESVAKLIDDAVALVEDSAIRKGLRLEKWLHRDDLVIECDRERLIQVLTNLLSNAVKFTSKGARITISTVEGDGGRVGIRVADEGRGIAAEDLPHVFDHYWQGEETAHLGTGLGLAIAKGIVEAHDGRISVESTVGAGTAFTLALPAAQRPLAPEPQPEAREPNPHRHARVLVVEDEATARAALAALLEEEGFEVTAVADGSEALSELQANGTDVLLADVEMPGLRGPELVRRARESLGHVPAILMTGHEADVAADLGGGARHVAKPLDVDELVTAIRETLDEEA